MPPFSTNSFALKLLITTALVVIAFSLRLYYINNTVVSGPIRADAADYYAYAINIKDHQIYSRTWPTEPAPKPDALRSPGFPFFISGIVSWPPTKQMVWTITFWQALLDTLTVLLSFLLARQFVSLKLAFSAAILTAISPHLISATSYLLSETLFAFLMTATLLACSIAFKKNSNWMFLAVGILLGLASLTRPTIQYFIAPMVVCVFIARNHLSLKKGVSVSLIIGFTLIYAPWIARNIHTLGITSDPTLTINTLHHGIYPDFMYRSDPQSKGIPYRFDPASPEIAASTKSALNEITRRFLSEPIRHIKWYMLDKPITFFSWNIIAGFGDVFIYPIVESPFIDNAFYKNIRDAMYWLHWPLVTLSIFACLAAWIPNNRLNTPKSTLIAIRLLSLLILYFVAVHVVGAPFPRYSIPLRPITYVLAVWSIDFFIRLVSTKRTEHATRL